MPTPPADEVTRRPGDPATGDTSLAPSAGAGSPAGAIDVATLVPHFESALLRYVSQLLGRRDDAIEDIVQDAFLRLHRHVTTNGTESIDNVSTWLFRVAHNLTMDTLRRRKVRRDYQEGLAQSERGSEHRGGEAMPSAGNFATHSGEAAGFSDGDSNGGIDALAELERREACQRAMTELGSLPENQRQAVQLRLEGLTVRQIAQVTDTSVGNVGYRISQGLAELSKRLKRAGVI